MYCKKSDFGHMFKVYVKFKHYRKVYDKFTDLTQKGLICMIE